MRSLLLISPLAGILGAGALAALGCSSAEDGAARQTQEATAAELAMAREAINVIAGTNAHCNMCHTASKQDIKRWGTAMQAVDRDCFVPELTREQRIQCLSADPGSHEFSAGKLGLYAAAARLAQFKDLFVPAEGGTAADAEAYNEFKLHAAMPTSDAFESMSDAQFAKVKQWVLAGMPALDEAMSDPNLGPCETSISPAVGQHLAAMKNEGWGARLADQSLALFGCGDKAGVECLTDLEDVSATWSAPGSNQTLRKLRNVPFRSHWWIRSSPDGRYTGFGLNNAAKIIDHTKPEGTTPIDVAASYDPVFFPNNEGFSFAGTNGGNGPIKVCRQSVLVNNTGRISLNEAGCSTIISSVYQTIGASLDNTLSLMSTGTHVNDDAEETGMGPRPGFDSAARTILTPMLSDGNTYVPQRNITLSLPFEGDQALSPSNKLLVTRFGSTSGKRGFRVRRLDVTTTPGTGGAAPTITATSETIGTVCVNGTKPAMSYDERFIVTHQYVDPTEGTGLPERSSNVVLVDLKTGEVVRLTKMASKQYAFAPHFRADGWIYFVVRDIGSGKETLVASDAALRRLAQ
jgi:hypothetical protein